MPVTAQDSIGHGQIVWLGINKEREGFSLPCNTLTILSDGIDEDMYRGLWREISGHDVDYIATDGVSRGDSVLNTRQITIVDEAEVKEASLQSGVAIEHGMLRENVVVSFTPVIDSQQFSKLPPLSRMVIGNERPKVLNLTEENGPCGTICNPISVHFGGAPDLSHKLRRHLEGRRGQMAMVRSYSTKPIQIGDYFTIFPPML